jgi:hypothetical protein
MALVRMCRYVRSVDSKQLGGRNSTTSACQPFSNIGVAGSPDNGIINPCGLIAHSNFNDTITVLNTGLVEDVSSSAAYSPYQPIFSRSNSHTRMAG